MHVCCMGWQRFVALAYVGRPAVAAVIVVLSTEHRSDGFQAKFLSRERIRSDENLPLASFDLESIAPPFEH